MFAWFSDVVAEILKNSEHLHVSKRDVMIMQEEYIDTLVWSFIYLKMHRKIKKKYQEYITLGIRYSGGRGITAPS